MAVCSSQGDESKADTKVTADSIHGDADVLAAEGTVLIAQPHDSAPTVSLTTPVGDGTNILSVPSTADVLPGLSRRNSWTVSYTKTLV